MKRKEIPIKLHAVTLTGEIVIPDDATGFVIFSHGSGSSRLSPRNKYVASQLNKNGIATLLFDLLTEDEDRFYGNRFNIKLLTERLISVTHEMEKYEGVKGLPVGYFGASTGAASALYAAAELGSEIKTVVSRGGRPDLAIDELHKVTASVLLIVGGLDGPVIKMNADALAHVRGQKKMEIVPGASHLFEEPGKLEEVARIATLWYKQNLVKDITVPV